MIIVIAHLLASVLLAGIVGCSGYTILERGLRTAQAEHLNSYIRARAVNEQRVFDDARTLNEAAEQAYRRRLLALQDMPVDAEFDRLFPLREDGTRRSAPALYDGMALAGGDYVFGIGAFLAEGEAMPADEKRRFLAAFHAVRDVGEAFMGRFSSLYFFTQDRRVVIFAPTRDDRLEFYRFEAPADFDLRGDEDATLFGLDTNPRGEMQCTALSRFVYAEGGERAATACRLPVRFGDALHGGFGTSISMTETIAATLEAPPSHGMNMLFDRDGRVISRGSIAQAQSGNNASGWAMEPDALMALLRLDPRPFGVFATADGRGLIAFSRIPGPSWYFVSVVDMSSIRQAAAMWGWVLFGLVLAVMLALLGLRPLLERVTATAKPGAARSGPADTE